MPNVIDQIKVLILERNSAKEIAAAANSRSIHAKVGKKKDNKKRKESESKHKRTDRKCPINIDAEVAADANACDACGGDRLLEVL